MAFVLDTFTDSDATALTAHTGETGATWAQHPSYTGNTFEIRTNRTRPASGGSGTSAYYAAGTPTNAEYDVSADFIRENSNAGIYALIGRADTSVSTLYRYGFDTSGTDQKPKLHKIVSGSVTLLATAASAVPSWAGSDSYVFKLELRDAAKKGYLDGAEVVSSVDNSITAAGKAGLWSSQGRAVGFDNFTATDVTAGATVSPNDVGHDHGGQIATLGQAHSLSCLSADHGHVADSAAVSQIHQAGINSTLHAHQADVVSLAAMSGINIASGNHGHLAEIVSVVQSHYLSPLPAYHDHSGDLAAIATDGAAAPWPRLLAPKRSDNSLTASKAATSITATKS